MRTLHKSLLLLGTSLFLAANLHAAAPSQLRIHGSNTIGAELMPVLAESWLKSKGYNNITRKELRTEELQLTGSNAAGEQLIVEINSHGSTTAFADLASGASDIGMASRPIKPHEVKSLAGHGKLDDVKSEYVLGLDGVAVIVNPANPLTKLDKNTLRKIFTGEIKDWAQVGGNAGPIHVLARDSNSGTFDTFNNLVLDEKGNLAAGAKRYESNEGLSAQVAADPSAIGFTGLAYVKRNRVLAIADGPTAIPPTTFSVATEDYALSRRLFLYVPQKGEQTQLAKEFADFTVSDKGQRMIDQVGFISQEIRAEPTVFATDLPEEYKQFTKGAKRLSLNFRFTNGSAGLDNKAQRDMGRLVVYMKRDTNAKGLMLFGFSDSAEAIPMVALNLSSDRADGVADLLVRQGLNPMRVRGYGSVAAVASNDSEAGRIKNRRVEVWVK